MNAPTSSSAGAEKLLSSVEAEISRLVEQKTRNPPTQIEADPERIKAAIARLTSNSIDGLEGLMSELQQLQAFLKGEVERVRGEIESALAGINKPSRCQKRLPARFVQDQRQILNPPLGERSDVITCPDESQICRSPGSPSESR